ncbi:MAG: nicotinate-nucleotide--dimethylbenzimidazole phosphoribosyltransferase [Eubacterium sp.]|nr:nicotinate-nucleotide--dimethylbenzimidazole phosphoribosyltransferase [Eubacterium sp.]
MSRSDDVRNIIEMGFGKPTGLDEEAGKLVRERLDDIAKPLDGLGDFEEILVKLGGITGTDKLDISKRAVIIMCADNGIVREGISQSDSSVTRDVAELMVEKKSSVGVMSEVVNCDTFPVNIGIKGEKIPGLIDMKIADGTADFLEEPAMRFDDAFQAISAGIELVGRLKKEGYKIIATGEMGIGNTTTAAAVISAVLYKMPEEIVGRGAGLSDEKLLHKINVVKDALRFHELDTGPKDIVDILCAVGGLDIAGMAGVFIGGALFRVPILIDGLISSAAALVAANIIPETVDYMIATHVGNEPGMKYVLEELSLKAVINAGLRLGEGTGAIMMLPLLDAALNLYNKGRRFRDIELENYKRYDV